MQLQGKLRTWSLSDEANPPGARQYMMAETVYGIFRNYVQCYTYDPATQQGEQREQFDRDVNRLYNEIVDQNYTPQVLNVSVTDQSTINVDNDGNVSVVLDGKDKLALLDGGGRFRALEKLRNISEDNHEFVDRLPICLIIYLQPEYRKIDFANLNNGKKVNKSHLQIMAISGGRIEGDKLEIFQRASKLVQSLNTDKSCPLAKKIGYGNTSDRGLIQFSQVCTNHKGSLIASLFGSAKLLEVTDKNNKYFVELFTSLWDIFAEQTESTQSGKLLSLPPDGPKGNVANWISLCNTVLYYLYLQEQIGNSSELEDHVKHIVNCGNVYNDLVNGDIGRRRRTLLTQGFGQRLFHPMINLKLPTNIHMGLPSSLLILTSESSFGVDPLPSLKKTKKENNNDE